METSHLHIYIYLLGTIQKTLQGGSFCGEGGHPDFDIRWRVHTDFANLLKWGGGGRADFAQN